MKKIVRWLFDDVGSALDICCVWFFTMLWLLLAGAPIVLAISSLYHCSGDLAVEHKVAAVYLIGFVITALIVVPTYLRSSGRKLDPMSLVPTVPLISYYWIVIPVFIITGICGAIDYGLEKLNKWSHEE